ncbi:MAG: hypothetical protein WCE73_08615 [Candidatus Angelobacter sp.]
MTVGRAALKKRWPRAATKKNRALLAAGHLRPGCAIMERFQGKDNSS